MIKTYDRAAKWAELKPYCHHAGNNDFIEVTEWYNGEGYDVTISSKGETHFSLTHGQFEALITLISYKE